MHACMPMHIYACSSLYFDTHICMHTRAHTHTLTHTHTHNILMLSINDAIFQIFNILTANIMLTVLFYLTRVLCSLCIWWSPVCCQLFTPRTSFREYYNNTWHATPSKCPVRRSKLSALCYLLFSHLISIKD